MDKFEIKCVDCGTVKTTTSHQIAVDIDVWGSAAKLCSSCGYETKWIKKEAS